MAFLPGRTERCLWQRHGLNVHLRPHSSFTPRRDGSGYLLMGRDQAATLKEIAKFSGRDADVYSEYEATLDRYGMDWRRMRAMGRPAKAVYARSGRSMPWRDPVRMVEPLLDMPPIDLSGGIGSLLGLATRLAGRGRGVSLADIPGLYELMTAPAARVLRTHVPALNRSRYETNQSKDRERWWHGPDPGPLVRVGRTDEHGVDAPCYWLSPSKQDRRRLRMAILALLADPQGDAGDRCRDWRRHEPLHSRQRVGRRRWSVGGPHACSR